MAKQTITTVKDLTKDEFRKLVEQYFSTRPAGIRTMINLEAEIEIFGLPSHLKERGIDVDQKELEKTFADIIVDKLRNISPADIFDIFVNPSLGNRIEFGILLGNKPAKAPTDEKGAKISITLPKRPGCTGV